MKKIRLPYHKLFFNTVRIKIKSILWSCRLSAKIILWLWFFWTCYFSFSGVISCFTVFCLAVIFYRSAIHTIYILLLIVGFIIIILIFFFYQRFLIKIGLVNRTADPYNPWIQSAFERILFIIYIVSFDVSCGTFGFCLHSFRNSDM